MIRFERSIRGQLKISSTPAIGYRMNRSPLILNDRFVVFYLIQRFILLYLSLEMEMSWLSQR